ncbi:hypothetical protein CIG19_18900 [Enterobacterales bacterium CwR94]|nr:hypothetical protein CIG19_18900 [Enterobacterales bacterium CwR94]
MNILLDDNGYHLSSNLGSASYDLNGKPFLKIGLTDNFPEELNVTDRRSAPSPSDVTVESLAFGVRVKWNWPVGAGIGWVANLRYSRIDASGETVESYKDVKNVDGSASASDVKYGLPVGERVFVLVSVTSPDGKKSKHVEAVGKTCDAFGVLFDIAKHESAPALFRVCNGRIHIKDALIKDSPNTITNAAVNVDSTQEDLARLIREQIIKEQQPGGLLHGR